MTDAQFVAWLKDSSAIRCVLVEVNVKSGGAETTRFLSNKGYVTSPTDTPANTQYAPLVVGNSVKFTETLSIDSTASLSVGDIELDNSSGDRDSWLDDVWTNRAIKVFIGDVRWVRSDFRQIFDGVVAGFDSKARGRFNLRISDKLQRLNIPTSETKLGGTTPNADKLLPICLGECHNIEPLLVDPNVNEYQVHDGAIERIIEVRDNGVPVAFTPFLSTGKFRLAAQPSGQVTASVQGAQVPQLLSPEQLVNGTFDGNLDGWTAPVTLVGGELVLNKTDPAAEAYTTTTVTGLVSGYLYELAMTARQIAGTGAVPYTVTPGYLAWYSTTAFEQTRQFEAAASTFDLMLRMGGGGNVTGTGGFSNISLVNKAGANVVPSGNFSNGLSGWYPVGSPTYSIISGELFISGTGTGDRVETQGATLLVPGQEYIVSYDVRAVSGSIGMNVIRGNAGGYALLGTARTTSTTTVRQTFKFVATGADAVVSCVVEGGSGFFDNIEVRPTNNIVQNPNFDIDTSLWTASRGAVTWNAGKLRVTLATQDPAAYQVVTVDPNKTYKLTVVYAGSSIPGTIYAGVQVRNGPISGIDDWTLPAIGSAGTYTYVFKPTGNTITLLLAVFGSTVNSWVEFDSAIIEDVTNLVSNGNFIGNAAGWTAHNGALLSFDSSGRVVISNNITRYGDISKAFTTIPGRTYRVTAFNTGGANDGRMHIGTSLSYYDIRANIAPTGNSIDTTFVAQGTTTYVTLTCNSGSQVGNTQWDNVSIKEIYEGAGYFNTTARIVKYLATNYGTGAQRLAYTDLNVESLAAFDVANPQGLGIYIKDRTNIIEALTRVSASVGGRVMMDRLGRLTLKKLSGAVNGVANPTMLGAVVGNPGVMPSNWAKGDVDRGVSSGVAAVGVEGGDAFIDISFTGTASATGAVLLVNTMDLTSNKVILGQNWICSLKTKLVSGTAPQTLPYMTMSGRNSAGQDNENTAVNFNMSSTLTKVEVEHTFVNPTTVSLGQYTVFVFNPNEVVNCVVRFAAPWLMLGRRVTNDDMVQHSLAISQLPAVKAGAQIGYCRNWTPQPTNIAAGVPVDHAALYAQEWLTVTRKDTLTAADYQTFSEPVQEDTLLLTNADAVAEANRRLAMWNTQRKVYKYVGTPWLMLEELGGNQHIYNNRFGLSGGKRGQIVSLATDWLNPHITVEILV